MPKSSKPAAARLRRNAAILKDPRVVMRAIIGVLLAANLVAAVIAFKPFGGSADDLRKEAAALQTRLSALELQVATDKKMVDKVQKARADGDLFLSRYFLDRNTTASAIDGELLRTAKEAGIRQLGASFTLDDIEGSDSLQMLSINAGYEGTYANLAKFVNQLDKSPRFLIIESMQTAGVQNGAMVTVQLKIDTFVKNENGAGL